MKQLKLFPEISQSVDTGNELRDKGIQKAEDHANEVIENWSGFAYNFLLDQINNGKPFMVEDIRDAAKGIIPDPPSLRAWGSIVVKAARNGEIKRIGYHKVRNARAHSTPASVWIKV